jgi:hypothetical protein
MIAAHLLASSFADLGINSDIDTEVMEVSSFEVSFHNWYDTRRETISIMDL